MLRFKREVQGFSSIMSICTGTKEGGMSPQTNGAFYAELKGGCKTFISLPGKGRRNKQKGVIQNKSSFSSVLRIYEMSTEAITFPHIDARKMCFRKG